MPRPYPEPSINSSLDVVKYANEVTNNWFSTLFALAAPVIIFIILKSKFYRTSDSLLVALLIGLVLDSLLWAGGLMAGRIIVVALLLTVAAAMYSVFDH